MPAPIQNIQEKITELINSINQTGNWLTVDMNWDGQHLTLKLRLGVID